MAEEQMGMAYTIAEKSQTLPSHSVKKCRQGLVGRLHEMLPKANCKVTTAFVTL